MENNLIIIPSRMQSKRLPGKPLLDIEGIPMVIRVAKQAIKSNSGLVYIACCDEEVYKTAKTYGINAIMTNPDHSSGTDRVYEAFKNIENTNNIKTIINLQGDMPTISSSVIRDLVKLKEKIPCDIFTLVNEINDEDEKLDKDIVKVVLSLEKSEKYGKALYFSRSLIPYGEGPVYHHIGIYAYSRDSLEKFITLKPSFLEKRESLEQLRALEANMNIKASVVKNNPIGVDNLADFNKACEYVRNNKI
ncbi:MAG: 3-deoxy-manno-octulosonate cytidylyltransferase [Pelagibacterales bacterium]|nr:3-deoxy-manno-octulosonate cytidylyltransferase [Pelagibacterales bacterium]PPR15693.1 MAG: 3-deoxy-manno-octulosonate cytidylyltransferase [Alphaproteobacteria bacterium MarineAlpha9_Bin3]|tara:strand:- start:1853 stop:2596 length:744 start_codon:yes stop_codon:yes gene_type:complete